MAGNCHCERRVNSLAETTGRITAATDGSRLGRSGPGGLGPGGWGWVTAGGSCDSSGELNTTHNRMELTAVLELLRSHPTEPLLIQLDSTYVMKVFTEWLPDWRKRKMLTSGGKPVKNPDLIDEIDRLLTGRDIRWEWVRGHSGHDLNEIADWLAGHAAARAKRLGPCRPLNSLAETTGRVTAATKGSWLGNLGLGLGGWGWVTDGGRCDSGGDLNTTNYRMELTAVLELLRSHLTEPLLIQLDSTYVIDVFTKRLPQWRRQNMRASGGKPIKNLDLIDEIARLLTGWDIKWESVRGRSGYDLNETADRLARHGAASQYTLKGRQ